MSHSLFEVTFRNTSSSTCVLKGYPAQVVATGPALHPVAGTDGSYFPNGWTANMAPGQTTVLGLGTVDLCARYPGGGGPPGPPYHVLSITLPGGGVVSATDRQGLDLRCGLTLTKFSAPDAGLPRHIEDPLTSLQATLFVPSTVTAGRTLTYVVELTNPTHDVVSLRRCPSYAQSILSRRAGLKDAHALNCTAVGSIGPFQRVRFAMQLRVPALPPGAARIFWSLGVGKVAAPPATVIVAPQR